MNIVRRIVYFCQCGTHMLSLSFLHQAQGKMYLYHCMIANISTARGRSRTKLWRCCILAPWFINGILCDYENDARSCTTLMKKQLKFNSIRFDLHSQCKPTYLMSFLFHCSIFNQSSSTRYVYAPCLRRTAHAF